MGKLALQVKASLDNVSEIQPDENNFRWYIKLKCMQCGEERNTWQYVTADTKHPISGSRGEASLVEKCKLCGRENVLDIVGNSSKKSIYTAEDDGQYKTLIVFDCRGIEPVSFQARDGFTVKASESSKKFEDVDLSANEWFDFDDISNKPVGITEWEYRFVKVK